MLILDLIVEFSFISTLFALRFLGRVWVLKDIGYEGTASGS